MHGFERRFPDLSCRMTVAAQEPLEIQLTSLHNDLQILFCLTMHSGSSTVRRKGTKRFCILPRGHSAVILQPSKKDGRVAIRVKHGEANPKVRSTAQLA